MKELSKKEFIEQVEAVFDSMCLLCPKRGNFNNDPLTPKCRQSGERPSFATCPLDGVKKMRECLISCAHSEESSYDAPYACPHYIKRIHADARNAYPLSGEEAFTLELEYRKLKRENARFIKWVNKMLKMLKPKRESKRNGAKQ